jgi:hypothetical protein
MLMTTSPPVEAATTPTVKIKVASRNVDRIEPSSGKSGD